MISLEHRIMGQGRTEPIDKWVVWFRTLTGLFTTLDDALMDASRTQMPPEMIRPVAVALDKHGHYEESQR